MASVEDWLFSRACKQEPVANARVAAAIFVGNKKVSSGYNQYRTDPFQAKYGRNEQSIFLHAEIHAIKKALKRLSVEDLRNCSLYIVRAKRQNHRGPFVYGLAKPCIGCYRAIVEFGLKNVFYSTEKGMVELARY